MALRLRISPLVRRKFVRWKLDEQYDGLLVDVYLYLSVVGEDPQSFLFRLVEPFDGLVTVFRQIDPHNHLREHRIYFHAVFSQDEQ